MPKCYHINWSIKIRTVSIVIMVIMATCAASSITNSYAQKEITLRALLDNLADPGRWDTLIQPAMQELRARHADANINIKYEQFPYNDTRNNIVTAMTNQTPIDIVSVDQIWLGEFAERGFLTDLTNYTKKWGNFQIGMQQTGMVVCMTVRYMVSGHGRMLEVCGPGKTCWGQ